MINSQPYSSKDKVVTRRTLSSGSDQQQQQQSENPAPLRRLPQTAAILSVLLVLSNLALLIPLSEQVLNRNATATTAENPLTELKIIGDKLEPKIIQPNKFPSYKNYLKDKQHVNNNVNNHNPATTIIEGGQQLQPQDPTTIGRTRAIVAVSMGKTATQSRIVERFVWSARQPHLGNYTGWIIIVTDAPFSRYEKLQKYGNNKGADPTLLIYHPFKEHYAAHVMWRDMTYKRFKTYILEYVGMDERMDSVEVIYYLDVDMVFARNVDDSFGQLEQQYNIAPNGADSPYPNQSKMFMFENTKPEYRVQGGQFVVHRRAATGCLGRWREYMIKYTRDPKDQRFLNEMWKEQANDPAQLARCQIVPLRHQEYIGFPNRTHMEAVFAQRQGARPWPVRLADFVVAWLYEPLFGKAKNPPLDPEGTYGPLTHKAYPALVHIKNDGSPRFTDKRLYQSYVQDVLGFEHHGDDEMGLAEKMIMTAGHKSKKQFAEMERKKEREEKKERERKRKEAAASNNDQRAIFLISMGEKSLNLTFVERFYWTARNIGKYTGWIVLLTDAPKSRYPEQLKDDKFVMLHPDQHKNLPKSEFSYEAMNFKQYKTYVLEYMNLDDRFEKVELVYYLDVDIVVGNSMQRLFDELEKQFDIGLGDGSPRVWMWSGHEKRVKIPQGGQMILHRKRSQTCLDEWRSFLMTDFESLADQDAMKKLLSSPTRKCDFVVMKRDRRYIDFPETGDVARRVEQLQKKPNDKKTKQFKYSTLIHFRNTAMVMKDVPADALEIYLRDVMGFQPGQHDDLGITTKMRMVAPSFKE